MKNVRLVISLLFICSCAPVNTTVSPNNIPTGKPSILSTPPPFLPSLTNPGVSSSNPTSNFIKNITKMKVISSSGEVMIEGNFDNGNFQPGNPNYEYTSLFNESTQFITEIIYKDGTIEKDGVLWNSSDPSIASVDQTGLVAAKNIKGNAAINISLKNDPSKTLTFNMQSVDNSTEIVTYKEGCQTKSILVYREKYKLQPFTYNIPVSQIDCETSSLATFNGKIYDVNGKLVETAIVNARSIDINNDWVGLTQLTFLGTYVFRNSPTGAKLEIAVTKDGWTTRKRTVVLRSNINDVRDNVFDFGGPYTDDLNYALQDEPEINLLKINSKEVTRAAKDDILQASGLPLKNIKPNPNQLSEKNNSLITPPNVGNLPDLTGVDGDSLEIEMNFSEPVNQIDVENNFRITSQSVFSSTPDDKKPIINGVANPNFPNGESFVINKNFSGSTFDWLNNDRKVIFRTNRAILTNKEGQEAKYIIDFSNYGFKDKTGKAARSAKQFRFSPTQVNDYAVFSVTNK